MNRKLTTKVVACVLCALMLFSIVPVTAFAAIPNWENENVVFDGTSFGTNGYYNVISKKDYVLVPGAAVESEIVLNNATGTRRQVLHIIEVDPSNPDVSIVPGYNQIDKDLENEANWSHKELTEMAKYYENNLGYNIVGGMNTDLYYSSYSPRVLVYNGKWIGNAGENVATGGEALGYTSSILYVFKDAEGNVSCDVKAFSKADVDKYLEEGILLHAVGVSFGMVVQDGKLVNNTEKRGTDDAARSMVGVKADGTLVICMNDGRGANNSVGFSSYEEGEAMLALGCEWAANCDGGGSSTFISKRVGEETFTMRSVPCDGAQRPTAHGIFVASNVGPTGELDVINVESDYDYFAPKTEYTFGAEAIDTHGYAMDMPADIAWKLSDASFGTIENGKFVSNGKTGSFDVVVTSGGKEVGKKTVTVSDPEIFKLSATSTVVPYSTADKVRTIALPIVAMIGEANVYVDTNAVSVVLSDTNAGVLDGFKFTATSDTKIAGVDVTVTYGDTALVYAIEFGKGSEIIYDFEDGDKAGFMGFEEAKKWSIDNGVNNTLVGSDPLAGQFNEYLSSTTGVYSAEEGGQVRNGNYALAWTLDNTDADFASWSYNVLFNTGDTVVLRDVANDMKATTLGMWLYIPEEAFQTGTTGLSFQSQLYAKNADGTYSCKQDHFMFASAATGKMTNLNSATNADIPESRWVYASIDISKYDYLCTPVATDEGNSRSPSFIRTYVKPTFPANITFYIDDITLDYSSAVDDRVLPTITAPTYSTADTAVSLDNGTVINGNKIAFSATVADNAALDLTTGKIFVDGVEVKATAAGSALSSAEDVVLGAGEHTVAFEIKDELGNPAKLVRNFTVAGDAVVELSGHNESGEAPKAQSVYYVDINVADLANVNKLTAALKLNNANVWEAEGISAANGFTAEYSYNAVSEILTVTVESTGKATSGAGAIVSIPVRVWTYDRYDYVKNEYHTVESMGNKPVVNIECEIVYGDVVLNDKTETSFAGSIFAATELTTISSPYHVHDEVLTVLNKPATNTEAGYENRTYCETCKSVVDWGTTLDVIPHNYVIVDGKFVCSDEGCDDVLVLGTGPITVNDKIYYAIAGNLVRGWQESEGVWYFLLSDYSAATGDYKIDGRIYHFNEDGSLIGGQWFAEGENYRYYIGPSYYKASNGATVVFQEIEGYTYGFDTSGYRITVDFVGRTAYGADYRLYHFNNEGHLYEVAATTGIVVLNNGTYYVVNDIAERPGLVKIGNDYYYIKSDYHPATGTYYVNRTNGLLAAGYYEFDADGKMILSQTDGVVDGYYYENGVVILGAGLIDINGDYYYVRSNGSVAIGTYYVNKTNGLLAAGYYEFDADGKMILDKADGVVDGYYYENGVIVLGAGLIKLDGVYYYIRSNGSVATGNYYVNKPNGLLPAGYYDFAEDGKLILGGVNGSIVNGYYYKNGVLMEGAGLINLNDAYYYVRSNGAVATGRYYVNKPNNLLPAGYYDFAEDGKLIVSTSNGVVDGFYYVNGVLAKGAGLVEFNGDYYYVRSNGAVATGRYYVNNPNGLVVAGYYEFDANGKMVVSSTVKDGIVDGYYYNNGVLMAGAGLIVVDDDYYYVRSSGAVATGKYYVNKPNDLLPAGYYNFAEDGKMIKD